MSRWIKNNLARLSSLSQITNSNPSASKIMEVEVKLRLPDSTAHQKLSDLLSPYHTKTHLQQNLFFDTPSLSLATTHLAALRLRFYDLDSHAILSLKAKPVIAAGISRIEEEEEFLDPSLARACAAEPWRFSTIEKSRILKRVNEEFGVDLMELVSLGGFRNVRAVHKWNGLKLELDETQFDFGVNYEIECESDDPDEAKLMLEELLNQNGICFSYSQVSKFAIFRSGKLPEFK
ncbi:triphosphate tunnel metalloenzyme 3 [Lactuca sativa]|uniref:triphosphate tunnel metalloenzyme 3 n=1 Tax=Lactuca sativa TaxID=4236 RepID=UPI000CC8E775|nr:triphosphate tunnel metalloenzyme 3 [Lactuca sativa]